MLVATELLSAARVAAVPRIDATLAAALGTLCFAQSERIFGLCFTHNSMIRQNPRTKARVLRELIHCIRSLKTAKACYLLGFDLEFNLPQAMLVAILIHSN